MFYSVHLPSELIIKTYFGAISGIIKSLTYYPIPPWFHLCIIFYTRCDNEITGKYFIEKVSQIDINLLQHTALAYLDTAAYVFSIVQSSRSSTTTLFSKSFVLALTSSINYKYVPFKALLEIFTNHIISHNYLDER